MPLISIPYTPPQLVRDVLPILDGITPEVADALAE